MIGPTKRQLRGSYHLAKQKRRRGNFIQNQKLASISKNKCKQNVQLQSMTSRKKNYK